MLLIGMNKTRVGDDSFLLPKGVINSVCLLLVHVLAAEDRKKSFFFILFGLFSGC